MVRFGTGLLILFLLFTGCGIDPNKTYTVYTVIDSTGKSYHNLIQSTVEEYRDVQGNSYIFKGNYTVISSTITGHDILKLRAEKE
jgi:hypothetical protein